MYSKVSYIDSKGVEHDRETLNYYWDFEQLPDVKENCFPNIDWNQVRIDAAIEKDMNGGAVVQNTWYNLYNFHSPYIECRLFPTKEDLLKSL